MAKIRVRLHPKDQPDYDRGGEWMDADDTALPVDIDDLPWDDVIAIERECGCTIPEVRRGSANHTRVWLWTVRRAAGVVEPFAKFKPRPYGFEVERLEEADGPADADPPVVSPPTSATAGRPRKSSSPSTRSSRVSSSSRRAKSGS